MSEICGEGENGAKVIVKWMGDIKSSNGKHFKNEINSSDKNK